MKREEEEGVGRRKGRLGHINHDNDELQERYEAYFIDLAAELEQGSRRGEVKSDGL